MDNLEKDLFSEEFKETKKFYHKLPKPLRIIVFFVFIVSWTFLSFYGGVKFDSLHINLNNNKQSGHDNTQIGIGSVQGTSTINLNSSNTCPVKFCSNFKDSKWENLDRFIKLQDDPLILESPHSAALPGATMFFPEEVGKFAMEVFITPQASNSANLVLAYGHFARCIIGDGDYTKISCQINEAYPKAVESWSYIDNDGKLYGKYEQHQIASFSPNKELQIRFSLDLIDTYPNLTVKINDQTPLNWKIPKDFQNRTQREKIGIGLFTTKFDDVQAVFKQFRLDPHL